MSSTSQLGSPATKIPVIDGFRGIAALAVMFYHAHVLFVASPFSRVVFYGWAGVDLFFVISGFLITRILLKSRGSKGYYRSFYARRILRIWPLYFVLLVLCISVDRFNPTIKWWAYPLFIQNLVVPGFGPALLSPTWSLAIEEQFYAIWPILVSLSRTGVLVGLTAAAFVFSAFTREYLLAHSGVFWLPYINTFGRLDGLALGALLAIAIRNNISSRLLRTICCIAFLGGLVGVVRTMDYISLLRPAHMWRHSFLALMFAGMLGLGVLSSLPFQRFFELPPLRMLGKISYGLYLLHVPVMGCVSWALQGSNRWLVGTLGFSATIAAATASFWLLERPFLTAPFRKKGAAHEPGASEQAQVLVA